MNIFTSRLLQSSLVVTLGLGAAQAAEPVAKPTVILVHGAFADSSSWDGVTAKLRKDGYPVIGAANPLRSVKGDADYIASIVKSVPGPVILVGHSYGGSVITAAVQYSSNVKALVYVAAFAPETGETAAGLSGKFPGGTLGPTLLAPVKLADGESDLYIQQDKFYSQFAADLPEAQAQLMAAGQRPVTIKALNEGAPAAPAWKYLPSYFIYGSADKNIPAAAIEFMAKRAAAKKVVAVDGASHVVMTSHPTEVAELIESAAALK
ncbi:alpha/beta hydrolase [Rugamonas sp.]|uniref:alpha/beta fold hydrolase n=1 Tax=Rugamonas sp. TaxID=1926287 RepID=UPI0025EEF444|nr:alpha/beta hydrolase [Rugamonas sp.]